jgi:hypothetical protein
LKTRTTRLVIPLTNTAEIYRIMSVANETNYIVSESAAQYMWISHCNEHKSCSIKIEKYTTDDILKLLKFYLEPE